MLSVEGLGFSYGLNRILDNVSFEAESGQVTAVLGVNGSGKTTLLRCLMGFNDFEGKVRIDGSSIRSLPHRAFHDTVSYLDQNASCNAGLTAFEVVLLGMISRLGFRVGDDDSARVDAVLDYLGLQEFSGKDVSELSGGQRQLVFIAQALVKNPTVLIMDEPTSALDLRRQFAFLERLRQITAERNCTTVITLHHLDMAALYADKLVVLHDKGLYAEGPVPDVFTSRMLADVYGVASEQYVDSRGETHLVFTGPCPENPAQKEQ